MKKFSIITLTLNSKRTIINTLESIDSQNYKNLEHICLDGFSDDGTLEILLRYKRKYRKIYKSKKRGLYKNLNKATSLSTGEYIGVLHSDDLFYDKHVIQKIAKKFENKNINIIYTNIKIVNKNNIKNIKRNWISNIKSFKNKTKSNLDYLDILKKGWMPPHTGFFIRKKIFDKIKYNTKYSISSDYDFMIRVITKFDGIYYLPITSTLMRTGGKSSRLSSILLKLKEDFYIIKKNNLGGYIVLMNKIFSKLNQFYR
jgi:glycosyltransferase